MRTRRSKGGAPQVSILSVNVSAVMVSGSRKLGAPELSSPFSEWLKAVDVLEECTVCPSFDEDDGEVEREIDCSDALSGPSPSIWLRMCCVMCVSENGRFDGGGRVLIGWLYVSTVFLTALVISSREV